MRYLIPFVFVASMLAGCGAQMEHYQFVQTMDKVPVPVLVSFSKKYPNDEITEIYEVKAYDGSVSYRFVSTNKQNVVHTTIVSADGKKVDVVTLL